MDIKVTLTALKHINDSKRRGRNYSLHNDRKAKFLRNSGIGYIRRNGTDGPERIPPNGAKICNRCRRQACSWNEIKKKVVFYAYWSPDADNHNKQSAILANCIRWTVPAERKVPLEAYTRKRFTYIYSLPDENGMYHEVCLATFLNVFGISKKRVVNVQKKLTSGDIRLTDGRGLHLNRPHRHPEELPDRMILHMHKYQKIISHFRRADGDPLREYLPCDLSVSKMFRDFLLESGLDDLSLESKYRSLFKKTGLKIGAPKSDTCNYCDRLYTELINTDRLAIERIRNLENEQLLHHETADQGYHQLRNDTEQAKEDLSFVVICIDLQKVLLSPKLSNAEYYYQRKFFTYNLGITLPSQNISTMCIWSENEGHRGYIEVASCIYKFIRTNFQRLEQGQHRVLTLWSDRCSGQNNNYGIVCLLKYILHLGYFTEINQKFMVSGHSFLPCDRHFAIIERKEKTATIYEPEDIVNVIADACPERPFTIQRMHREDFKAFGILLQLIPRPRTLKVSQVHWLQMSIVHSGIFSTKRNHNLQSEWTLHEILDPFAGRIPIIQRRIWDSQWLEDIDFVTEYPALIPISALKIVDFRAMLPYIPANRQPFLLQLIADNETPAN